MLSIEEKDIFEPDKKEDIDEEGFSDELSKSLVIPELSITKIIQEKVKELNMDDIFFILDPKWKTDIKPEYKKYPSLIFFLLKNPDCEREIIYYLSKTDSIQKKENDKFPTFLLILRIFSDLNCIDLTINTHNFFGSLIREEILSSLKRKDFEAYKKAPDINWVGLLINRPDINKYLSPKMNYIYNYLENFAEYPFKPYEENKDNYKKIIHKLIDLLIDVIFKGKLDELFSEEIIKIEDKESIDKKEIKIKDILYLTKLPDLIKFIIKEENNKNEKNLHNKFSDNIKNINDIYNKNKKLFNEFINAIETDIENEKKRRIEFNYNKTKNSLESECKEKEGKLCGYLAIIKNINDKKLSFKDYNNEIKSLIKTRDFIKKEKKYFNNKVVHKCVAITFKEKFTKCTISCGDYSQEIKNINKDSIYYLNSININSNKIVIKKKNIKLEERTHYKKEEIKFNDINEVFKKKKYEEYQNNIKSIKKQSPKEIEVILTINKSKVISGKIKENQDLKKLEKIMGENGLKKQLSKARNIIEEGKYIYKDIKKIITEFKNIYDILNQLELNTPRFENGIDSPELTSNYCDKFNNEFKDMIIGKLDSLIKYYDIFDSLKQKAKINLESFDNSFSIDILEKKKKKIKKLIIDKSCKFNINYPYIALLSDLTIPKLQFGYNSYILNIGPIITSFYSGAKFTYNIVSFVDKNLSAKLIFDKDKIDENSKELIDCFSIKSKINSNELISIYFKVPPSFKNKKNILIGKLEIKIEEIDTKIKPISIDFTFNVILLPLEIYFQSNNGPLFWDENKLVLYNSNFSEGEILGFEYSIRNFDENLSFLNNNYSLKSIMKNDTENPPDIIQDINNNTYKIKIPNIKRKQEFLEGLFKIHFSNNMTIPLELSGKIKKTDFNVFYYNPIYDDIEEFKSTVFLYNHQLKYKKPFNIELHFLLLLYDNDEHKFQLILPENEYPQYNIQIHLKDHENKNNFKNNIKKGLFLNIIAKIPQNYDDSFDKKNLIFIVDGEEKKLNIQFIKEQKNKDYTFFKLLDKNNNCLLKDYKFINNIKFPKKNTNDFCVLFRPFCVKLIYNKNIKDLIIIPGEEKEFGEFYEGIKLILFLKEFNNFWYPNINFFGDESFKEQYVMELEESNIDEAKKQICKLYNSLRAKHRTWYLNYKYEEIKDTDTKYKELNKYGFLFDFIYWLISEKEEIIEKKRKLKKIVEKMGKNYSKILSPLIDKLIKKKDLKENKNKKKRKKVKTGIDEENDDKLLPIKYYNILIELRKILLERYNLIKSYDYNISKIYRKNIKNISMKFIEKCFPPYNEKKFYEKAISKNKKTINEKKIIGKLSKIWLFIENDNKLEPIPKDEIILKDEDGLKKDTKKNTKKANFNLNLNILKTKDLSDANSLDKIISILKNGFSISQAFMFCIGKLDDDQINTIFNYLYEIYNQTKNSSKSILSKEIKLFSNAFETLCLSLKDSNVKLKNFEDLPTSIQTKNIIINEEKPTPNLFKFQSGVFWRGKGSSYPKFVDKNDEITEIKVTMDKENIPMPTKKIEEKKEENDKKKEKLSLLTSGIKFDTENRIRGRAISIEDIDSDNEEDKEKEIIHLKQSDIIVPMKSEEINKLKAVSDEGVTKNVVKRMLNKNLDLDLKLSDIFPEFKSEIYGERINILKKTLNRIEGDDFIEQSLYELINDLSKNLYIKLFQQCINFDREEVCAVIGIDLCRTIDKKFKLFHTIIATAMAHCFNSIEIPYAIVVFCDFGVQFVIKDFNEPHQEDISQLIFDAIMVPRCSTRIADACYFISQKVNCENRFNKKVFIISNGLDSKLKIGEKWAQIFSNEKEKFCFYFIKPDIKEENDDKNILNEISNIWADFQEKTRTEMAKISLEDILNGNYSTYLAFKNTMQSKIFKNIDSKTKFKISQPDFKEVVKFQKDEFLKLLNSINNEIINSNDYFVQNRIHISSKEKYKVEDFIIKNPFITSKGECLDEEYNLEIIDKDSKSALEKLFTNQIASEMKLEYIEFIFAPNKPTMYSPSVKGTRLYLMGLINFCITHGQDNKIWLEKNKGLKKDYRVSVIIDSSISCFNEYMRPHSIKTVLAVLRMLSLAEIPYFDLIISTPTKPVVLCSGNDTTISLNLKSNLWNIILEQLTYNQEECNLIDALKLVYKLKSLNNAKRNYCFVLTDGMFDQNKSNELQDYVSFCEECSLEVFGIGLGYYPEGIKKIFNKCFWSINPFMILKGMSILFGNTEKYLDNLPLISLEKRNIGEVLSKFAIIISKLNSYQVYKTLYGFLDGLPLLMESLDEITNPDKADIIGTNNPEISDSNTMCKKGEFEGFKILIGMFWSHILSETESEWVDKKYLLEKFEKDKECLKEVLDYYSIEIVIKEDYKECMQELMTGEYYAHWIICGDGAGKLPNGGNFNLIDQYIEVLKIYWVNGGSIVFWNDNEPFTFECNLFLKMAEFPGEVSKTKVRFGGNHDGKKVMLPGDININITGESEFGKFNNKRKFNDGKFPMFSLGHNLVKIAEGTTVSYVQECESIAPFNIFGYEHQGGTNILFYTPPSKYDHGYLILEGGFTKLFNELDTDGTKRYILNIASFTTQFSKRFGKIGENWKTDFLITPFNFNIDESVISSIPTMTKNKDFDIVYLLDSTGSMGSYLAAARDQCINISNQLKSELPQFDFNFGAIFYRDPVDCPGEKNHTYSLKNDVAVLKNELSSETATGGGDGPEDWVGAYDLALNNLAWRNGTRLIIHIADAPAHGSEWCGSSNHDEENKKLYPLIQKCIDKGIKIIAFQIGSYPKPSFEKFQKEYNSKGGILYKIQEFQSGMSSSEISVHFKDMVVASTHAAAPK